MFAIFCLGNVAVTAKSVLDACNAGQIEGGTSAPATMWPEEEIDKHHNDLEHFNHFSQEFSEQQYFIEHDRVHHEGFTSAVYLPPEA